MNPNNYDNDFNSPGIQVNEENHKVNYSQVEKGSPSLGPRNYNIQGVAVNLNNNNVNAQINNQNEPKRKNRTLQFYKFLLYSMKMEIKMCELIDVVRFSNQSEISIWILGIVLYFNSPSDYSNFFVWIHVIHLIRGIIGFLILLKLPRSYNLVDAMQVSEVEMETKLFNDIARDVVKREVVDKLSSMRGWLIAYFALTFINFIIDIIDFFYCLNRVDDYYMSSNTKAILLTYLIIAFLYLGKIISNFSNRPNLFILALRS